MATPRPGAPGALRTAVLGGTGWLGRHVCELAARRGHHVLAVARRPRPHVATHQFAELDLARASPESIGRLLREHRVDVVVNATDAANATDGWARTDEDLADLNLGLVRRLLAALGTVEKRVRLVHIGTMHEYGEVPAGTVMDEALHPRPVTPYTRSKLAGSQAVLAATRTGAADGLVLRVANVSGPHPSPESFPGKLVALLREAVATGDRMPVTLGDARRDFVDVRDVAEAVLKAVESTATGQAVNIGSGTAVDMPTLVRLFVTAAGYPAEILDERAQEVRSLGGAWSRADIQRAAHLLGWRPRTSLAESLRDMWWTDRAEHRPVVGR
ncbi:NAD-dependent epimerase/dehydratase family protein [Streptomyces rubiginosohelvolus]|uniref:NAD-dependent epimerase/dehydratase family protein n=1 Tax=Streptomyces rubiginosohelvolus TaxID=67362 RepID=UPI0035DC42D0